MKRFSSFFILCLCAGFLSTAAEAQEQSANEQARQFYEHGIKLYEQGDAKAAAGAFREAYRMRPSWKILFNIGQCEAAAGRYGLAMEAFQQYLVDGRDDIPVERKDYVLKEISRLRELVGKLEVEAPEGSEVYVDQEHRGTAPLTRAVLVVGGKDHKLIVKMPGGAVFEQTVSIWGGESKKVRAEVKEAAAGVEGKPAAEEEPLPTEPEEAESEEPARIWTWVAYGVGGAAAVGAGVTIGLGYSKNSDVRDSCDDKECPSDLKDDAEQVESLALATDVLIGVAAIGIAAGTLLYFFEPEWMGDSDGDVQVAPAVSDGHAGVLIQGRF